ncbi:MULTISPECIES: hypothetical protein [unclassified Pseudomonas]|uniref:hypothetical protein n=1 Tax=unclassified Pseudomonas TaxID=196821 RepID=UPI000837FF7B|nr:MULTISPECIES: hypothetical protein [unclassified Pseudomonas]QIH09246.1 SH3 domain-containing protein [Pseudomonas sp. BIOMIG1BAC]
MDRPLRLLPLCGMLLLLPLPALANPAIDCAALGESASQEAGDYRPPLEAKVTGTGRLHFHSAPNPACVDKKLFVIPGDGLTVYASTENGWAQVMYIAKGGEDYTGWVEEQRLQFAGHYGRAQLPAEVTTFLQRHEECLHFAGEEPYDAERRAELEKATKTCIGLDRQLASLREQYKDDAEVIQALAPLENLE